MIGWQCVRSILFLSATAATSTAVAAGEVGPTSRSSISISVTIPTRVQAQVLGDTKAGTSIEGPSQSQLLCLSTSDPGSSYSITVSPRSNAPATAAVVQSEDAPRIALEWVDRQSNPRRAELTPGKTLPGFIGASSGDCRAGPGEGGALTLSSTPSAENANPGAFTLIIAPD